jgi:phosphatidylglycerophosphate synthase
VRTSTPSIAELRAATQPASIFERNSGEHWAGRLYMRRVSPYLTRLLLRAGVTPNTATWLMIAVGLLAAAALSFPGLATAVGAVALIQLQLALDCSDGELARWTQRRSVAGVYLDRVGHYLTETALPIALGVRADGGWDSIGGWTALGLTVSVLILMLKAETHLLQLARVRAGRDAVASLAERAAGRSWLRQGTRLLPYFRPFHAVEASFLAFAAAVVDALADDLVGSRILVGALAAAAVVAVAAHLAAVLASDRLR